GGRGEERWVGGWDGAPRIFFFQAEDGIRDYKVTGVQTCALPILFRMSAPVMRVNDRSWAVSCFSSSPMMSSTSPPEQNPRPSPVIGRASCRERVWISVGGVVLQKKPRQGLVPDVS